MSNSDLGLDPYRLPGGVRPTRYDISLRPSLGDASFEGAVTIRLDIDHATRTLALNAVELDIRSVTVDDRSVTWTLDATTERLIVDVGTELVDPTATMHIEFAGILNDKLRGFYRSTYVDGDGVEQVIATTQMQSTDCRRAFPCWDEPDFKAVFGVTLDVEEGLTAISNGPEVERLTTAGRTVIRFADTMKMSSYLVAFVVGRLEMTEPVDVDGIPLRIVHVPGKSDLTQFGLDAGAFCLRWFQEYYGIPYPSDKVDLVALPDFAAGAMENLGCITFRETLLLIDPATSTQLERQLVADVIAHELAHMWFGDLVTMRWWNGIWLNEAFATFMEIAAVEAFAPEWSRWTSFGLERSVAFEVDSLASTRSVEFEVNSPADCEGMFDVLTYQKGAALLRMLEQYLGTERFREGVNHYLRTHSYANTETNDLWDAIEQTSGEPVRRIMDSWIWQPGYPLVNADLVDHDGRTMLELRQQRFAYTPATDDDGVEVPNEQTWVIPLHVRQADGTQIVLVESATPVVLPVADGTDPIVVNANGFGFVRVAYGPRLRERFTDPAALAGLSTLERYGLVDDAWAATVAGRMSATDLLTLLDGFVDEREYGVWQAVVLALGGLSRLVDGDALDALRGRVRALLGPTLTELGGPAAGEPELTARLRGMLTRTMGTLGADDATRATCREIFAASIAGEPVDPEMLSAATSVTASCGGRAEFDLMLDGFHTATKPQDQLRYMYTLAEFDDADLVLETCALALTDAVRTQNAPFLIRSAITSRNHGHVAWEFLKENWTAANDRFPINTIVRMVDAVKLLTAPGDVADAATFFEAHPIEQAVNGLAQVLERQRINTALRERDGAALTTALLT